MLQPACANGDWASWSEQSLRAFSNIGGPKNQAGWLLQKNPSQDGVNGFATRQLHQSMNDSSLCQNSARYLGEAFTRGDNINLPFDGRALGGIRRQDELVTFSNQQPLGNKNEAGPRHDNLCYPELNCKNLRCGQYRSCRWTHMRQPRLESFNGREV